MLSELFRRFQIGSHGWTPSARIIRSNPGRLHTMHISLASDNTASADEVARKGFRMIDVDVPLLTHDHRRLLLRDASGECGLVAVGVGRASGRGFQMLDRFATSCDWLDRRGINVVFVYPAESARHVQDALSVMAARYRQKPCLMLDDSGRFFKDALPARLLRAMRFDRRMKRRDTAVFALPQAGWNPLLREFLMRAGMEAGIELVSDRGDGL